MHLPPGHVYARVALGLGGHRRQNRFAGSEIVGRVEGEGVAAGGSDAPLPVTQQPAPLLAEDPQGPLRGGSTADGLIEGDGYVGGGWGVAQIAGRAQGRDSGDLS